MTGWMLSIFFFLLPSTHPTSAAQCLQPLDSIFLFALAARKLRTKSVSHLWSELYFLWILFFQHGSSFHFNFFNYLYITLQLVANKLSRSFLAHVLKINQGSRVTHLLCCWPPLGSVPFFSKSPLFHLLPNNPSPPPRFSSCGTHAMFIFPFMDSSLLLTHTTRPCYWSGCFFGLPSGFFHSWIFI